MRISVIIPCFNEEAMLGACLESLQKQTRAPDEIIVVNNNCTDATEDIARAFGVRVVHEKQQGIVFARNAGFTDATGDLLVRCDADTRFLPEYLEKLSTLATTSSADAFTGPCFFYDRGLGRLMGLLHRPLFFWVSRAYQGHHTLFGSNMALRFAMWQRVRHDVCNDGDHVFHEDVDLALHIRQAGGTILYSPALLSSISARRMTHAPRDLVRYVTRWLTTMQYHVSPKGSTSRKE